MSDEQIAQVEQRIRGTIYKNYPGNACIRCHITPEGHQLHPPYQGQPLRMFASSRPTILRTTSLEAARAWQRQQTSEPTPPEGETYTGVKPCAACHYSQYQVWQTTAHVEATAELPAKYRSDVQCLECHVTGGGQPGGYTAGTSPRVWTNLLGVTCESCHGPGSAHVRLAKQFVGCQCITPQAEQSVRAMIYAIQPNVCTKCHARQRHGTHPEFERQKPTAAAVSLRLDR